MRLFPFPLLLWLLLSGLCSAELESSLSGELLSDDASYGHQLLLLSRHRRFLLPSSRGWSLRAGVSLVVPIVSLRKAVTFAIPFVYDLFTGIATGRKSDDDERNRAQLISRVEDFLWRFSGVNGHACMLRTLCEIAQVPDHADGFMGDALNVLLAPSFIMERLADVANPNEYLKAQRDGRVYDNCSAYLAGCPYSFFELIEGNVGGASYANNTLPPPPVPQSFSDLNEDDFDAFDSYHEMARLPSPGERNRNEDNDLPFVNF